METLILRGSPPDGSGYGSGYGSGSGYGYGDGDGSGYGYGYGDGSGSGYGYGDGDGEYWRAALPALMTNWSDAQRQRADALIAIGTPLAYWRSNQAGKPANGGHLNEPAAIGQTHRVQGPLQLCESGTLHATLIPPKWKGERIWIVALHGQVIGDEEKYGCLEREILGEAILQ